MKIDYNEIKLWIENDESLYNWWKASHKPISTFIKENRKELVLIIESVIG